MTEQQRFDPAALTKAAEDVLTVRRVFGEAYERDGVLVIPVARVLGGLGTGSGAGEGRAPWQARFGRATAPDEPAAPDEAEPDGPDGPRAPGAAHAHGSGHGGGGGYGVCVKPLGVYVVDAAGARFRPSFDVNHVVLGLQAVAGVALAVGLLARALRRR